VHTEAPKAEPARARRGTPPKAEKRKPDYPKGTVLIPCDKCGEDMADYEDTCWNCGAKYELDEDVPPPKAPKASKAEKLQTQTWAGEGEDDLGF